MEIVNVFQLMDWVQSIGSWCLSTALRKILGPLQGCILHQLKEHQDLFLKSASDIGGGSRVTRAMPLLLTV